ncbi:MAG: macro domain-containing protein [Maribacter sp.]
MKHIKIFDKSRRILDGDFDVAVTPANDYLGVAKIHEIITYIFVEHCDLLREQNKIRAENKIKAFDTFLLSPKKGVNPFLMIGVLPIAANKNSKEQLVQFYRSVFEKASENKLKSLRLPSLAEGVYHYEKDDVVHIGLAIASEYPGIQIEFYCYNDEYYHMFSERLASLKV